MIKNLNLEKYDFAQINEIETGFYFGVDITPYVDETYDWKQMGEIRRGLEQGLNIDFYKSK